MIGMRTRPVKPEKQTDGDKTMDDLEKYIEKRKKRSRAFADGFETGYEQFKIGLMLRNAREEAGLTQEDNKLPDLNELKSKSG